MIHGGLGPTVREPRSGFEKQQPIAFGLPNSLRQFIPVQQFAAGMFGYAHRLGPGFAID
jgi:hypothetical protein